MQFARKHQLCHLMASRRRNHCFEVQPKVSVSLLNKYNELPLQQKAQKLLYIS